MGWQDGNWCGMGWKTNLMWGDNAWTHYDSTYYDIYDHKICTYLDHRPMNS